MTRVPGLRFVTLVPEDVKGLVVKRKFLVAGVLAILKCYMAARFPVLVMQEQVFALA